MLGVVVGQGVGFFDAADGSDVRARNSCGVIAEFPAAGVDFCLQIGDDLGVLRVEVFGFADVAFEVVELLHLFVVLADMQLPLAAAHGFDAIAFIIEKGLVRAFCVFFGLHERANVLAVDGAVGGQGSAGDSGQGGMQVHRQRELVALGAGGDHAGPTHDAGHALAAFPGSALGTAQWGVAAAFVACTGAVVAGEDD